VSRFLMVHQHN